MFGERVWSCVVLAGWNSELARVGHSVRVFHGLDRWQGVPLSVVSWRSLRDPGASHYQPFLILNLTYYSIPFYKVRRDEYPGWVTVGKLHL